MKKINLNLSDVKIKGNVLDITKRGFTVISQLLKGSLYSPYDMDIYDYNPSKTIKLADRYDYVISFFAFNSLLNKKVLYRIIEKVLPSLNVGSIFMIYDICEEKFSFRERYNIKVKLKDGEEKLQLNTYFNPFRVRKDDIIKYLKKKGFIILMDDNFNDYYYVEAKYLGEGNNDEGSSSST